MSKHCIFRCLPTGKLYRFPKKRPMLNAWCEILSLDPSKITTYSKICKRHFRKSDIGQKRIDLKAVPLGRDGQEHIEDEHHIDFKQQEMTQKAQYKINDMEMQIYKLQQKVQRLQKNDTQIEVQDDAYNKSDPELGTESESDIPNKAVPENHESESDIPNKAVPENYESETSIQELCKAELGSEEQEQLQIKPVTNTYKRRREKSHCHYTLKQPNCTSCKKEKQALRAQIKSLKDTICKQNIENKILQGKLKSMTEICMKTSKRNQVLSKEKLQLKTINENTKQYFQKRLKRSIVPVQDTSENSFIFAGILCGKSPNLSYNAQKLLIRLHKASPKMYRYMKFNLEFKLPHENAVARWQESNKVPTENSEVRQMQTYAANSNGSDLNSNVPHTIESESYPDEDPLRNTIKIESCEDEIANNIEYIDALPQDSDKINNSNDQIIIKSQSCTNEDPLQNTIKGESRTDEVVVINAAMEYMDEEFLEELIDVVHSE